MSIGLARERIDIYLYEFLSNEYRRSFVEMHYRACDFIMKDNTFGNIFAARMPEVFRKCPFPQAEYHLVNLSYPDVPLLKTFPFQKGRLFVSFSVPKTKELLVETYIDVLIKSRWR
ncbi:uncharacterized protein LOC133520973 [Cydia pomonella]|uniref:uncharacterized protein LOC133520973 n=1 Tax=Cydia pomonella TaxID=82600 RepID=UPI002ADE9546|nr:uncharacterized protein LOC133520973 [Cydia pomonella]